MKKVAHNIYIGGREDALMYEFDSYLCTAEDFDKQKVRYKWGKKIVKKVGLVDGLGNKKETIFRTVDILDNLAKQGSVLIFCQKGQSRSPCIYLAYLLIKKNQNLAKAWYHLRMTKKDVQINPYLSLMLCEIFNVKYYEE